MPRPPEGATAVGSIAGSVFSSLAHRLTSHEGEVYPFHVGDTWLEPAQGCRMQDLSVERNPGMHRYAPPHGLPSLLDAIVDHARSRIDAVTERENVLVTAGATGALAVTAGAILEPGDEVLVIAPYWPLITGVIRCCRGRPVVVPVIGAADSPESAVEAVQAGLTARTVALYINTPNNPTGRVLPREWIEALVAWAQRQNLWILSDEVYEHYVYRGEHTYCRALAPDTTFSVHSFSKSYGMAGNRCGYVIGPATMMKAVRKVSTHTVYCAPMASQLSADVALRERGEAWLDRVRDQYRSMGERAAARIGIDPPEGSTFIFVDASARLDERGLLGFLEDCADRGLFLAPGPSFGPYPGHVRLCFTAAAPDVVERGVEVFASHLGV